MTWRLRRAGPGDAPALSLVAAAAFLDAYAGVLDAADIVAHCARHNSVETFAAWLDDPATMVTLAEHEAGAAPIGYTVVTTPDFPIPIGPGDVELRRIYVLTQFHRSGLGTALMRRAEADASASGADRLSLGVWDQNARARTFYERQGFVVVGARQFLVGATMHDDPVYAKAV